MCRKFTYCSVLLVAVAMLTFVVAGVAQAEAIYIDDSQAGFFHNPTWATSCAAPGAYLDNEHYLAGDGVGGDGYGYGQWRFTGLEEGQYKLWASWNVRPNYTAEGVDYAVHVNVTGTLSTVYGITGSQRVSAFRSVALGDIDDAGGTTDTAWQSLLDMGTVEVTDDGTLYVTFNAQNNGDREHYVGCDGIRVELIPEPGTLALLATGLIGLLCYAWRKRKCAPR